MKYYYLKRHHGIFKYHQNGTKYGFRYRYYLNHKQHEISHRGFNTLNDALNALTNVKALNSTNGNQGNVSVKALCTRYLNLIKGVRKISTYQSYKRLLSEHIVSVIGNYKLNALKLDIYQSKVINQMLKHGLSHRTVEETNARFQTVMNYAVKDNLIKSNPIRFATVSRTNLRPKKVILNDKQLNKFNQTLAREPIQIQVVFDLLEYTGCRIGEALALRFKDIDLQHHIIHISRTRDELGTRRAKTIHSIRKFKITNALNSVLTKYAIYCNKHYRVNQSSLLLRGIKGKPMLPNEPSIILKKLLILSGLGKLKSKFTPHSFRHLFVSRMINDGVSPITVASIVGHANSSITMSVYAQSANGVTPDLQNIIQSHQK